MNNDSYDLVTIGTAIVLGALRPDDDSEDITDSEQPDMDESKPSYQKGIDAQNKTGGRDMSKSTKEESKKKDEQKKKTYSDTKLMDGKDRFRDVSNDPLNKHVTSWILAGETIKINGESVKASIIAIDSTKRSVHRGGKGEFRESITNVSNYISKNKLEQMRKWLSDTTGENYVITPASGRVDERMLMRDSQKFKIRNGALFNNEKYDQKMNSENVRNQLVILVIMPHPMKAITLTRANEMLQTIISTSPIKLFNSNPTLIPYDLVTPQLRTVLAKVGTEKSINDTANLVLNGRAAPAKIKPTGKFEYDVDDVQARALEHPDKVSRIGNSKHLEVEMEGGSKRIVPGSINMNMDGSIDEIVKREKPAIESMHVAPPIEPKKKTRARKSKKGSTT